MYEFSKHVGKQIRLYRKIKGITLDKFARMINKSRATLCKYENGKIILDIETLYEISNALNVDCSQLIDFKPQKKIPDNNLAEIKMSGKSHFYYAKKLYFYFYDGRVKKIKTGIINIAREKNINNNYQATFFIDLANNNKVFYIGNVIYGDMLIRFSFVNQYNFLEEDLLYIFNPLEYRNFTYGLLSGISSADLMPCAYKCLVSLEKFDDIDKLKEKLLFAKNEINTWKKLNMMLIINGM